MCDANVITLAGTEAGAGKKIQAIQLIRSLGCLRPGDPTPFGLREAKLMAELMLEDATPVAFEAPLGLHYLVAQAVAPLLCPIDSVGVYATDLEFSGGWLARLEAYANTGFDSYEDEAD